MLCQVTPPFPTARAAPAEKLMGDPFKHEIYFLLTVGDNVKALFTIDLNIMKQNSQNRAVIINGIYSTLK